MHSRKKIKRAVFNLENNMNSEGFSGNEGTRRNYTYINKWTITVIGGDEIKKMDCIARSGNRDGDETLAKNLF